jgi:hypothetical protein
MNRFCSEVVARKLDVSWQAFTRGESGFTQELTDKMAEAGCSKVFVGVESASDETLARMDKGNTSKELRGYFERCHKSKIAIHASFIVGFPGETDGEAYKIPETYLANTMQITVPGFSTYVFTFMLERGNRVWRDPNKYELKVLGQDIGLGVMSSYSSVGVQKASDLERTRKTLNGLIHKACRGRNPLFDFFGDYRFSDYIIYHSVLKEKLYDPARLTELEVSASKEDEPVQQTGDFWASLLSHPECFQITSDHGIKPTSLVTNTAKLRQQLGSLVEESVDEAWTSGFLSNHVFRRGSESPGCEPSPPTVMIVKTVRLNVPELSRIFVELDFETAKILALIQENTNAEQLWRAYSSAYGYGSEDFSKFITFIAYLHELSRVGLIEVGKLDGNCSTLVSTLGEAI